MEKGGEVQKCPIRDEPLLPPYANKRVFVVGAKLAFRGWLPVCSCHSGFPLVYNWFPLKSGVRLDVSRLAGGAFWGVFTRLFGSPVCSRKGVFAKKFISANVLFTTRKINIFFRGS